MKEINLTELLTDKYFISGQYLFEKQGNSLWVKHIIIKACDENVKVTEVE